MAYSVEKEIHRISKELQNLKEQLRVRKLSSQQKLRRYHALLDRISRCSKVDLTPDEAISGLRKKEY